jgi:hypothetical protein
MTILHVAEDTLRDEMKIPGFYEPRDVWVADEAGLTRTTVHTRAPWLWWYLSLYQWTYKMYQRQLASDVTLGRVPLRAARVRPTVTWMQDEVRRGRSIYPLAKWNRILRLGSSRCKAA